MYGPHCQPPLPSRKCNATTIISFGAVKKSPYIILDFNGGCLTVPSAGSLRGKLLEVPKQLSQTISTM